MASDPLKYWAPSLFLSTAALLFALTPARALAQQASSITGTVLDPRGGALPHALVEVKDEATGSITKVTADEVGHFASPALPAGKYDVQVIVAGFAPVIRKAIALDGSRSRDLPISLNLADAADDVTVEAAASGSIAAALAPVGSLLEARSARSEINSVYIDEFTSPVSDYGEILNVAPGTATVSSNGVGEGQTKTVFRGFSDGEFDITLDGIPFEDTNSPTHHSWAFAPSPWIGNIDFDRSPGTASTIGPTPFGGSINVITKDISPIPSIRGSVSYGSFNTRLFDFQFDSGSLFSSHKLAMSGDIHRMTSDGFQTFNFQERNAGELKVQYKVSDKTILTGFSGVIWMDANTPNNTAPTRQQVQQYGYNYLLENTDQTSPYYFAYNTYHVPTDFEYVGVKSALGHGWLVDVKPYTYSYYNAQYYPNGTPINASCFTETPTKTKNSSGQTVTVGVFPCATDKLNSYRKYGEVSTISQTSHFGVFRTGLWYEWATTDRYQIPSNPLAKGGTGNPIAVPGSQLDSVLPNFHERFYTNSYQPYAEFEWHATRKLSITAGTKYAYYQMDLTQYADNGKTVGYLQGPGSFITNSGGYHSWLPSVDASYRIKPNWSAYAEFGKGDIIPPSSVFDVNQTTGTGVKTLPAPSGTSTYQAGTVAKLKRFTVDGDFYYIKFQNSYISVPDIVVTTATDYYLGPDSITKGFETSGNFYLGYGLSLYGNGSVTKATYTGTGVPSNLWVAGTPANIEGFGLTYQGRNLDMGVFEKRIGPSFDDNGTFHNQNYDASFNTVNLNLNYTVRNDSRFDRTKFAVSFNNLLDARDVTSIKFAGKPTAAVTNGVASQYYATSAIGSGDLLTQTPGRSVMVSVTFGFTPGLR
ncbi:MAG TPA: TonB-dependent receptor [Granulicella sp.]|nr:TonB-dependent receptor [Granulicella sp.]